MDIDAQQTPDADGDFFRAIVLGAAIGVPALWIVMTLAFSATTNASFLAVAGFSALPAVFCGPFLGGLFTTALANSRNEHASRKPVGAVGTIEEELHRARPKHAA